MAKGRLLDIFREGKTLREALVVGFELYTYPISIFTLVCVLVHTIAHKHLVFHLPLETRVLRACS